MGSYHIGEAAALAGMSVDTLRYYERIGLMQRTTRDQGGRRLYTETALERLYFIARAQAMDFTLAEIGVLLELRTNPVGARKEARRMVVDKLEAVTERLQVLGHLQDELTLLLNRCAGSAESCPILEMESGIAAPGAPCPTAQQVKYPAA